MCLDGSVAAEIERYDEKITDWEAKRLENLHYSKLITEAENKKRRRKKEGDRRKAEIDRMFESNLEIELVGIATVTPGADANAKTMSDRAGMEIVMERERKRARTEEERRQVCDVSGRDTGYDIETSDRSIEVKSFEGRSKPRDSQPRVADGGKVRGSVLAVCGRERAFWRRHHRNAEPARGSWKYVHQGNKHG